MNELSAKRIDEDREVPGLLDDPESPDDYPLLDEDPDLEEDEDEEEREDGEAAHGS
jgi:hypothetical protein